MSECECRIRSQERGDATGANTERRNERTKERTTQRTTNEQSIERTNEQSNEQIVVELVVESSSCWSVRPAVSHSFFCSVANSLWWCVCLYAGRLRNLLLLCLSWRRLRVQAAAAIGTGCGVNGLTSWLDDAIGTEPLHLVEPAMTNGRHWAVRGTSVACLLELGLGRLLRHYTWCRRHQCAPSLAVLTTRDVFTFCQTQATQVLCVAQQLRVHDNVASATVEKVCRRYGFSGVPSLNLASKLIVRRFPCSFVRRSQRVALPWSSVRHVGFDAWELK